MSKTYKAVKSSARKVGDRLCFVLTGVDDRGKTVEIAVPAEGLQPVFADAERAIHAARAQEGRASIGEYVKTITRSGTPAQVGVMSTTDGEKVVLTVHPNLPSEMPLSYSIEDARALASELLAAADRAAAEISSRPKPN